MPSSHNSAELLADGFVSYLFNQYRGTRHVRRIASWIGFIIKAVERLPGVSFSRRHSRQLGFEYRGRKFKARYNHTAGVRGGIDIGEYQAEQIMRARVREIRQKAAEKQRSSIELYRLPNTGSRQHRDYAFG